MLCLFFKEADTPIKVHQDVNLFATEFTELDQSVTFTIQPNRMAYLLCMEGSISLSSATSDSSVTAVKHDAVELQGADEAVTVTVTARELEDREGGKSAHFMYFEMKQDAHGGRTDV
jgi:hypothetical protein